MERNELVIVVVNWNQRELTCNCLRSIFDNPPSCSYQVVLVDNASTDGSVAEVRALYPQVMVLENDNNIGLVKANNLAVRSTDSEFIVFMNNDTIIKPLCFDTLVTFMREHHNAGIAGARMYYGDGTLQMSCFSFPTIMNTLYESLGLTSLFPRSRLFGQYEMTWWDHEQVRLVDWVSTACYIIRRDAFNKAGMLDEWFFVYNDDIDMGYKMRRLGYEVYYLPQAELLHLSGRNVTAISERKIRESVLSLRYVMRKNHTQIYYELWRFIKINGVILKIIKWAIYSLICSDEKKLQCNRIKWQFTRALKYFIISKIEL